MVAAAAAANAPDPARTSRPPLTPALDKPNSGAAPQRRPARSNKPVSSRYLASAASPTSSTSSTSSSSSSASSRRSLSAQRGRSSTPPPQHTTSPTPAATAGTVTATTMRSLSVSFQGESFFYQTSRAPRAASPSSPGGGGGRRGPTPERRKSVSSVPEAENARPQHRWPAAKPKASDPLARSLDCNLDRKDSILAAVQLLRRSMAFDSTTSFSPSDPAAAGAPDLSASSDTDSVSSGSNSGAGDPPRRGISVPARFWQETNSRLRRLPDAGLPLPSSSGRRSFSDSQMSPRLPGRSPSPSRGSRGMASPSKGRAGEASPNGHMVQMAANAPSIISFAAEVRRAKKGENRIEEAHRLRMLDNQHLQWRCINARTDATLLVQSFSAEKTLHSAWKEISKLRDNVSSKRCKLQLQKQKLKLFAILRGEMSYLEEWSHIEKHHSSSLLAAIKALKASTLRLPVVDGAKADAQCVKEAVNSAVDVMHTMTSSMSNLLSKVEGTSSVVYELAKLATQEQMLLDQSRDLLSTVAAIHVKQCSLKTHMLQRTQRQGQPQW